MKKIKTRVAFTLIEVVMVIVILGIVAMIASDIISKMYQGYLYSKIVNDLQQKTEIALDEISKRLRYRIKFTTIAKDANDTTKFKRLANDDNSSNYNVLEWIGYDNDSLRGEYNSSINYPGWSGFVDIYSADTNASQISTKGSRLDFADDIIKALSNNKISLTSSSNNFPAIIFKKVTNAEPIMFGLDPSHPNEHNNTYLVKQKTPATDILEFIDDSNKTIYEQYYLAWSAYALVPDKNAKDNDFNLTLYYNYQPWLGENYEQNGSKSVIAEHVSTFRFTQSGNTINIKLCIQDGNQTGKVIAFCKEKAVF